MSLHVRASGEISRFFKFNLHDFAHFVSFLDFNNEEKFESLKSWVLMQYRAAHIGCLSAKAKRGGEKGAAERCSSRICIQWSQLTVWPHRNIYEIRLPPIVCKRLRASNTVIPRFSFRIEMIVEKVIFGT